MKRKDVDGYMAYMPPKTVPCELCGTRTMMTGTKRCDRCWELEMRIESDPALARLILEKCCSAA